ncbi:MAG: hypothetical protein A2Y10_00695 [Planctomycetes bacterium GWF2_41_51]|nr:MAG: hypothetical protein A2Y10_00695 [Planctomycetes bacterium GWF2_41_51]
MINFKNVLISITAILLIANFSFAASKKKAPKEKAPEAETKVIEEQAAPSPEPTPEAAPAPAPTPEPAPEPNKPAEANQPNPNAVAVVVNGTEITEGQINKVLDARMEQLASRIPPNMKDQYRQQMRKRLMEQLVIEEILSQKEKAKNITVSQADVNEQVQQQMKQQNLTLDEFKSLLKAYGTNYTEFEQNVRKKLAFEKLMEDEFAGKITEPNEQQAKAFYDENIEQFKEPEKIHAKHILIKAEDSNDPNQAKAAAKAKAEDLLKKIKEGADFDELAKEHSACPSGKNGGDLGEQPKGTFVPAFEKAAYALEPNQVSDVVETEFGYHIIKLVKHSEAKTTTFEQAKEKIMQHLTNQQKEGVVVNYIQQIKKEADIKFTNPEDNFETPAPRPVMPERTRPDKNEPNN